MVWEVTELINFNSIRDSALPMMNSLSAILSLLDNVSFDCFTNSNSNKFIIEYCSLLECFETTNQTDLLIKVKLLHLPRNDLLAQMPRNNSIFQIIFFRRHLTRSTRWGLPLRSWPLSTTMTFTTLIRGTRSRKVELLGNKTEVLNQAQHLHKEHFLRMSPPLCAQVIAF